MIIIVEGLDKSGKSTVVRDLKDELRNPVVFKLKNKPLDDSPKEKEKVRVAYKELFGQAIDLSSSHHFIFDRAYPSELVYSVKRGYDAMEDDFWWDLDEQLGHLNDILYVYCTAPKDVALKRFQTENEEFMKPEDFERLQERYIRFYDKTKLWNKIKISSVMERESNLKRIRSAIRSIPLD